MTLRALVVAKLRRLLEQIKPASLAFWARDERVRAARGNRIFAVALWLWRHLRIYFWSSPYAFVSQLALGLILACLAPTH
jgi:hypothetical protein